MGHTCAILTFEHNDKKQIQAECDEWGNYNCDLQERGGNLYGLGSPVRFTDKCFDNLEDAENYLEKTFGDYRQIAVRYKTLPTKERRTAEFGFEASTKGKALTTKYYKTMKEVNAFNEPHYKGVKSKYIKCRGCGSTLATEYCGTSWNNICPICKTDVRPDSVIEKMKAKKVKLKEVEKELKKAKEEYFSKMEKKKILAWAVACEVHS